MGDRGQIKVGGVYLYTHYGGSELKQTLQEALKRKQRWQDEEYLTRIIFSEMIKNEVMEETGYGIGTKMHFDLNSDLIEVDVANQKVKLGSKVYSFEKFTTTKFK